MKIKNRKKIFLIILACIIFVAGVAYYATAGIREDRAKRKMVHDAAQKTVNYYYKEFKKQEFGGVLDWPALGLFGFNEDVSGYKWTANGKNGAYWREREVKEGVMLSKTKNTDFQRTIIGVCSAGKNPYSFGGSNLVKTVRGTMLDNGHFADSVADNTTGKPVGDMLINAHDFAIIALHSAGQPIPNRDKCLKWLVDNQGFDGGFTWDVKEFDNPEDYKLVDSDVDMTAACITAMHILGVDKNYPPMKRAVQFLKKKQGKNGGFSSWGTDNPESCSWAIQAITSIGDDVMGKEWTTATGENPVTSMLRFQLPNGAFCHILDKEEDSAMYDNGISTYEALYGMADAYNKKSAYDMLFEKYRPIAYKNLFSDMDYKNKDFEVVTNVVYKYILPIDSSGLFKANDKITVKDLCVGIINGLGYENECRKFIEKDKNQKSKDIYDEYIQFCSSKGFLQNINDIKKDSNITGKEFITSVACASNMIKEMNKDKAIDKAKDKGFLYENFKGNEQVTRLQFATTLNKLSQ